MRVLGTARQELKQRSDPTAQAQAQANAAQTLGQNAQTQAAGQMLATGNPQGAANALAAIDAAP